MKSGSNELNKLALKFFDACRDGQINVLQHILNDKRLNFDINITLNGISALHVAVGNGRIDVVRFLLDNHIDTDKKANITLTKFGQKKACHNITADDLAKMYHTENHQEIHKLISVHRVKKHFASPSRTEFRVTYDHIPYQEKLLRGLIWHTEKETEKEGEQKPSKKRKLQQLAETTSESSKKEKIGIARR